MQGSHTHIPETNHILRGYTVAAILSLLFMVPLCLVPALVLLFFYVSIYYYYYYCVIVSFMQGSHTRIPETNHVPRGYTVAAILSLLFMVPLCLVPALVLLFFYVSTLLLLLLLRLVRNRYFSTDIVRTDFVEYNYKISHGGDRANFDERKIFPREICRNVQYHVSSSHNSLIILSNRILNINFIL